MKIAAWQQFMTDGLAVPQCPLSGREMEGFEIITGALTAFWEISKLMAPWLLLGFFVAGIMSELIPESVMERFAGKPGLWSIVKVSLLGVPLPICSCGIVPVAAALKKRGASRGAVSAFLITTPQTGAESIAVTWSMLGWIYALFRVAAAFLTGIICGIAVEHLAPPHVEAEEPEVTSCCTQKSCCSDAEEAEPTSKPNPYVRVFAYAFGDLPRDLGNLLLIGLVAAAALEFFIPKDFLSGLGGSPWAMLLMLAAGLPMYVCSTASVPIAAALMLKGVSPGAALVFLVTGPATNAAALTALSKIIGKRALIIYLTTLVILSLAFGFLLDMIPGVNGAKEAMEHAQSGPNWLGTISAIFLYLTIIRVWLVDAITKRKGT
jgi:uncharacterized protein